MLNHKKFKITVTCWNRTQSFYMMFANKRKGQLNAKGLVKHRCNGGETTMYRIKRVIKRWTGLIRRGLAYEWDDRATQERTSGIKTCWIFHCWSCAKRDWPAGCIHSMQGQTAWTGKGWQPSTALLNSLGDGSLANARHIARRHHLTTVSWKEKLQNSDPLTFLLSSPNCWTISIKVCSAFKLWTLPFWDFLWL